MATINFNSKAVRKQAKLLEEAADQIQNQTVKVMNSANEALAVSWSGKAGEIFVKFMQEQSKDLSSQTASLKEVAAFLRDACNTMEKAEAQAILDYTRLIAEINNSEIEEPDRTAFISTISELISDELNHQERLFELYVALSGIEPNKD